MKRKGIEDVLTLEMLKEYMLRDPNIPLEQAESLTPEAFQFFIRAVKGTPLEDQMVKALEGVDMDSIVFTDLRKPTEH